MTTDTPDRMNWFSDESDTPLIAEYAKRLDSFLAAIADGVIDDSELSAQESRVVDLMKEIEPQLDDELHEKVTRLLCEQTAYDIMQFMHSMQESRERVRFEG